MARGYHWHPVWFQSREVPCSFCYWVNNKATLDVDNILQTALAAKKCCDEAGTEQLEKLEANIAYLYKLIAAAE